MSLPTTDPDPTHPAEAADPDCLPLTTAADRLAAVACRRMVVVGDSVALGVREPVAGYRDASFAERVRDLLARTRPDFVYRNLAVRDQRLAEIRATQLDDALAFGPDLAMIAAGGNDALRRSFDEDRVRRELVALAEPLAAHGALVVTIGMFDLARSGLVPAEHARALAARFDRLDEITAEVAAGLGGVHADCHHHPRAADPAIFSGDRIHANARGHAIAAGVVVTALVAALAGPDRS